MAEYEKKERYKGVWQGRRVSFARTWRGHRFSDEECARLCDGQEIEISGLTSKSGNTYGVYGRLADLTSSNGVKYVGVEQSGFLKRGLPKVFLTYEFTEDERIMLESGRSVRVEGLVGKKGVPFATKLHYDADEDRIVFDEFG